MYNNERQFYEMSCVIKTSIDSMTNLLDDMSADKLTEEKKAAYIDAMRYFVKNIKNKIDEINDVLLLQILGGDHRGLVGGGHTGGEGDHQHIPACFQGGDHLLCPVIGVGSSGGGHDTVTDLVIEGLDGSGLGEAGVALAVVHNCQTDAGNLQGFQLLLRQIAAGIGNNLIGHFIHSVILD